MSRRARSRRRSRRAEPIAAVAGVAIDLEPDLREAERPYVCAYEDAVRRYLEGEPLEGWEPADAARMRFAACVARLVTDANGDVVAVSHGLVMSLYLGLSFGDWRSLPFPAVVERAR